MPRRRTGRLPGFEYQGHFVYALTICAFAGIPRFEDKDIVAETHRIFCEAVERQVCCVLNNPVRAGLVNKWHEWPHSGTSVSVADEDFERLLKREA